MNKFLVYGLLGAAVILICGIGIDVVNRRIRNAQKHELHLLDKTEGRVFSYVNFEGGKLPTNWLSLSNIVDWNLFVDICERGRLPLPTESYAVLANPVPLHANAREFVFFIGRQPRRWPNRRLGRWALTISSNDVSRVWLDESEISQEIKSRTVSN